MELAQYILTNLAFSPTEQQAELVERLAQFLVSKEQPKAFILKGYAGTGKTSVVSALAQSLHQLQVKTILLAPTGRAAKVLGEYAGYPATTIHKEIYRQHNIASERFDLNYNSYHDAVFIVDEASMISSHSQESAFGSGSLLDDMMEYIFSGDNCSLILLGDTAQLLPIGQESSPALDEQQLHHYGLYTQSFTLTQVIRQANESGILYNATRLRNAIEGEVFEPVKFDVGFKDIKRITGAELIEELESSYSRPGLEDCIILTYSNKRAVLYNRGVRAQVLMCEDELNAGDYLMVTKNNYYWAEQYQNLGFIANGDIAEVLRVGRIEQVGGVRFADLTLRLLDYEVEITAKVAIDSLYIETPQAQNQFQEKLLAAVAPKYGDIGDKRLFFKALAKDECYNALQVKFAYAITTHKAQGGAWQHVFIDQGYLTEDMISRSYYQWLYTAFTRAKKKLYLVNFSDYFFE